MGIKWLITGGCGFIGTNLIGRLRAQGTHHAIRVVDNLSVGNCDDLRRVADFCHVPTHQLRPMTSRPSGFHCELIEGDILDEALALEACRGADIIVHLAANTGVSPSVADPRSDCMNNVLGTLNYLEGARLDKVKRFVFASSGAPAGEVDPPIHEELPPHPISPYGASKLAGEGYCSAYFRTYEVETVALRFGNVYGPGSTRKSSVVAKFIRAGLSGEPLEIFGDGRQTRDFIFIEDLVEAILLASRVAGIGGETFQVASNTETTIKQLASMLSEAFLHRGYPAPRVRYLDHRKGDVRRNFSDATKARRLLAWQADMPLNRGLQVTVDWFIQKHFYANHPDNLQASDPAAAL